MPIDMYKIVQSSIIYNSKKVVTQMFKRVVLFGIEWKGPREVSGRWITFFLNPSGGYLYVNSINCILMIYAFL